MNDWIIWGVLAGVLVILEVFTGTFYLLMVAIGFAAGALAAWLGAETAVQLLIAGVVGVTATIALRRSKWGKLAHTDAARDPNVNLDVGQTLPIEEWKTGVGQNTARVMYRGAMWDVELEPGGTAVPGLFAIREVRGNRLVVANA